MKADVVLVVKVDVSQASAVIERMQQVLAAEFGVPAPDHEHNWVNALNGMNESMGYLICGVCGAERPKRSASGLGPEIGSRWKFAHVPDDSPAAYTVWEVKEPPADFRLGRPFRVYMERADDGGGPRVWAGSVAKHNSDFTEATG